MSAVAVSSAACLTLLELLPHSSNDAAKKAPTTYGSTFLPSFSHRALMISNDPSRALAGVPLPRFVSVPNDPALDMVASPKLVKLAADVLGFNPPDPTLSRENIDSMPSGKSMRCISSKIPHARSTYEIPNSLHAIAKSAAAIPRLLDVLSVRGLLLSIKTVSPMASRYKSWTLFLRARSSNAFKSATAGAVASLDGFNFTTAPRFVPALALDDAFPMLTLADFLAGILCFVPAVMDAMVAACSVR
mmetsp:Transcript_27029/g.76046  ORF Transcript_27029/g.76046 Transcript_27029/m.76046 type:complete len:246 (+) Transcript_27029:1073-1810(+)